MSFSRCLLAVLMFSLLGVTPADAQRRRGNSRGNNRGAAMAKAQREATIKAAQAQYAQGEAVLSAALSNGSGAESRLAAVIGTMQSSVTELKEAQSQAIDLKKELIEIERDILREQSNDSPFARAQAEMESRRAESQKLEAKLLGSPEYAAKKAVIARETDGPAAVARFRKDTLDGSVEYSNLQLKIEDLASTVAKLKRELYAADSEWKETHEQMLAARKDAGEATSEVYKTAPERADPRRDIRTAKEAAAAARSVMAHAEAVLKQYKAPTKPAATSSAKK